MARLTQASGRAGCRASSSWAAVLDQRGLPASLIAHLFHIGENQMRALIQHTRPLLQQHGHHSEPLPVRLIDPSELARYVMHTEDRRHFRRRTSGRVSHR